MGILYNGNGWDITQSAVSGTANVVNGFNIGTPASGVTTAFLIPTNFNSSTKQFTVAKLSALGTVTVSGTSPQTINGATAALTVANLVGKTFINYSGNDWASF